MTGSIALGQFGFGTLGAKRVAAPSPSAAQAEQPRILWIKNEKTGQIVYPEQAAVQAGELPDPVMVYDNFSNPNGVVGINLNWNYPEASTNPDFKAPEGGAPLNFGVLDLASDPTDPGSQLFGGEKACLMYEPYTAAPSTWPTNDLNEYQPIREYWGTASSYSAQFEIRICRITFFSLQDVNQPFDPDHNRYETTLQLSFGYVAFPFRLLQTAFRFNLANFNPPLEIKGKGLILTHWMKLSEPPPCKGDLNTDGMVEDGDFVEFLQQYNILDCADESMPDLCSADLNGDGFVDDADFVEFLVAYNGLVCPPGFVIRKAYALLAGGRFRWDNETNSPMTIDGPGEAVPVPSQSWPFPNSLVQVPNLSSNPPYPNLGCHYFGCEPSFSAYFTTLTGFHTVDELNMDLDRPLLAAEYARFLNEVAADTSELGSLRQFAIYDAASYSEGGPLETDWIPSSTPKKLMITPPTALKK